jgi:uncharacterized protein (UPF0332 family)
VDPIDFFKTAELLKSHTEESHLRTSVGRSYYAAFLYFRERLRSLGLEKKINRNRDTHVFVIQCLGFSQVPEGMKASKYLHDLQQTREDADYQLDKEFVPNDAKDAFDKAKKVIANYNKNITSEKEKELIGKATLYAKGKSWI